MTADERRRASYMLWAGYTPSYVAGMLLESRRDVARCITEEKA